ncbi:hypothetical protein COCSUDRAFT_12734, partial [Coccomyxa subellipsoidea C-169]
SIRHILDALQGLLIRPSLTLGIGSCFRPVLLSLVSAFVDARLSGATRSGPSHAAVSVALISLLDLAPQLESRTPFVKTETVARNLEAAALVLCQQRALLLEGPPGSGKSAVVEELAAATGNSDFIHVHVDDQMDAKSLLGAYVCTAVPGEFVWQPGPLTQAVLEGKWLVIEDINLAPMDVLAALIPLLERRELQLPQPDAQLPRAAFLESADCYTAMIAKPEVRPAMRAMEAVAVATAQQEPVLLVGETGTGKTTLVQQIAEQVGTNLVVLNLSQQTDSADLLGGFQPVEPRHALLPLLDRFQGLVRRTWDRGNNDEFLGRAIKYAQRRKWSSLLKAFHTAIGKLSAAERAAKVAEGGFAFAFKEGALVQALRNGDWVLLDEINLAPSEERKLVDGAGSKPTYNLRTLCRALEYARTVLPVYGLLRALYDGCSMAFHTQLSPSSAPVMEGLLQTHILGAGTKLKALLRAPAPPQGGSHVLFDHFWVEAGDQPLPEPSAEAEAGRGPTSSGKTSLVTHLARATGHRCVRINNHEQTDLQEYLGSYVADEAGRLVFREGALVTAVRAGHWVILDELNLAPSEVLEALNRLLDDNRELYVPELGEMVRPHPHFMLFATQNPAGAYGGRKALSRAFRSRFLELHVGDIPDSELAHILQLRCALAPSYAAKLVAVMRELQRLRQATNVFAGKHGFITPRDLFKWAGRGAVGYQELGENGCLLLAERLRDPAERDVVQKAIEDIMRVKIDPQELVLEPGRTLTLAEKGGAGAEEVVAAAGFRLVATMNPGGDYGKRELSPALANRFTTVWVPPIEDEAELAQILNARVADEEVRQEVAGRLLDFWRFFRVAAGPAAGGALSVRDLLAWAGFVNAAAPRIGALAAYAHGAHLVLLDGIGLGIGLPTQLKRSVLLEGSPGVGKTALVAALARASGEHPFAWCDGPLLAALKAGDWVLLDELNLAGQSVLEGLNALLDHRAEVFIPELGSSFQCPPTFRIFAAQNPVQEGGGRRGLPKSFLNRFTRVHVELLDVHDLQFIAGSLHPAVPASEAAAAHFARLLFLQRMRAAADRAFVSRAFAEHWGTALPAFRRPPILASPEAINIGWATLQRAQQGEANPNTRTGTKDDLQLLQGQGAALESLAQCMQLSWMCILVGPSGSGEQLVHSFQLQKSHCMHVWCKIPFWLGSRFEWVDGALTRAIEEGRWVLLDNANMCSATVLDRLNPLLEPAGALLLNEAGTANGRPRVLQPHPNFRLILALDPKHGELSRAMRNRGIEVFVADAPADEGREPGASGPLLGASETSESQDLMAVLALQGVPGSALPRAMVAAHLAVRARTTAPHPVLDSIYPAFAALSAFEAALLDPHSAPQIQWTPQLAQQEYGMQTGPDGEPRVSRETVAAVAAALSSDWGLRRALLEGAGLFAMAAALAAGRKGTSIRDLLASSSHSLLVQLLQPVLLPLLALVLEGSQATRAAGPAAAYGAQTLSLEAKRGAAWVLLGAARLHLASPPPGTDPAAKYAHKRAHLLAVLEDPSQYPALQQELARFMHNLGSVQRIVALLQALQVCHEAGQQGAADQAGVWQQNADAWASRLLPAFPLYADLLQPVALAVYEMRAGFSMLAHAHTALQTVGTSLELGAFEAVLTALLGAWEEVKAAEEARAALEAQLFKTKTQSTTILTEEAKEEADYKQTFPDHSAAFADILDAEGVAGAGMVAEAPLKAALTGLELLLARSQVWQETAASHVSLAPQLERLAALALRWRRLQLAAWRSLIRTLAQRHAAVQTLVAILENVHAYYNQFSPLVDKAIKDSLAPIEKRLEDFVKLAKWEDRGYHSLKQSTEKAQRQLHKLQRQAIAALKQPSAAVLADAAKSMGMADLTAPEAAAQDAVHWRAFCTAVIADLQASAVHVPAANETDTVRPDGSTLYRQRIPQLAQRMQDVLASSLDNVGHHASPSDIFCAADAGSLDALAGEVAQRALDLRGAADKGARSRKKKALTDLLHALAAAGLSRQRSAVPSVERSVAAAQRLSEHALFLQRRQRAFLGRLSTAAERLRSLSSTLSDFSASVDAPPASAALAPLLGMAAGALQAVAARYLALHKALAKLGYVAASLFVGLMQEGFCTAEASEEEAGVEMEGDFQGDIHDVPSDAENSEEEENEDEDGEKLDQEMGDVGEQGEAPDEAPAPDQEAAEEEQREEGGEGPINEDTEEGYEQRQFAAPQVSRYLEHMTRRHASAGTGDRGAGARGGCSRQQKAGANRRAGIAEDEEDEDMGEDAEEEAGGEDDEDAGEVSTEEAAALRAQMEELLRQPTASDDADAQYGRDMWARCEALTAEQLRLILEPTHATRLAGEYRSGKRLNMRRVIAYIASHFRKDKIWLRRTRPDQRTYQVSPPLPAVGQLGVLRFGGTDHVRLLHALDAPFTDANGPAVLSALRFDQDNTLADRPMVELLTMLMHMLDLARANAAAHGSAQQLHQLVLVLADGRFHEKDSLRRMVMEAASRPGVLLAFIILDNPAASVLDMQAVQFVGGQPTFSKYLDSFPFPFYIVLRDLASLPSTLASLLRQWFELSAAGAMG